MLRRGKDAPFAPIRRAITNYTGSNGAAPPETPPMSATPPAAEMELEDELALVTAEAQHTPETTAPETTRPESRRPDPPLRTHRDEPGTPPPAVSYSPPVATPEPASEVSWLRRPLRIRRGSEPDTTPPPAARPTYPSGQPATPGGQLLGALLVAQGLVTPEQLDQALADQATSGMRLGELLLHRGSLDERQLTQRARRSVRD